LSVRAYFSFPRNHFYPYLINPGLALEEDEDPPAPCEKPEKPKAQDLQQDAAGYAALTAAK